MIRVDHVMGMPVVVDVCDDEAADAVFAWLRHVDAVFSTYREDSEISRLRRGELALEDASLEVREVLARCDELRDETDGYFDVEAASPGGIDPSGLVKGWSVERAAAILDGRGCSSYAINAGGDVLVRGDERRRIGIQHPLLANAVCSVIELTDGAVATSGAYARGDHVLDPHTGEPPRGVLAVTVVGPDLGTVDAYATAAFAMGMRAPRWTARLPRGYEAMTILADETVLTTPGFPASA